MSEIPATPKASSLRVDSLTPHPRNYRAHPEDQVDHLAASLRQHGFYRNVVVARDGTILAGHGVVEAAKAVGLKSVPGVRLDIEPDSPQALKILTSDNELTRFAEVDDRELTALLKEISETDLTGLLGTGYDEMVLANLVMITRYGSEIRNIDEAAEWIGMPDYEPEGDIFKIVVSFRSEEDRKRFIEEHDIRSILTFGAAKSSKVMSAWWPTPTEVFNDGGLYYSAVES